MVNLSLPQIATALSWLFADPGEDWRADNIGNLGFPQNDSAVFQVGKGGGGRRKGKRRKTDKKKDSARELVDRERAGEQGE